MRATINQTNGGEVVLCYDHYATGTRVRRVFQLGKTRSCIREYYPDGTYTIVRSRLGHLGAIVACECVSDMARVIRREYRAMRRREGR